MIFFKFIHTPDLELFITPHRCTKELVGLERDVWTRDCLGSGLVGEAWWGLVLVVAGGGTGTVAEELSELARHGSNEAFHQLVDRGPLRLLAHVLGQIGEHLFASLGGGRDGGGGDLRQPHGGGG